MRGRAQLRGAKVPVPTSPPCSSRTMFPVATSSLFKHLRGGDSTVPVPDHPFYEGIFCISNINLPCLKLDDVPLFLSLVPLAPSFCHGEGSRLLEIIQLS